MSEPTEHPAFTLAKSLPEPWRSHFPKTTEEARKWNPRILRYELAMRVLVVMTTRVECAWSAYCDAVPGENHDDEEADVLRFGSSVPERVARLLFPHVPAEVPYAR